MISSSPTIHDHWFDKKLNEEMFEFYEMAAIQEKEREQTIEWQTDNLEYDLRTTQWILDKVRNNEAYAQNIYAALANNVFVKNEVWNILTDKQWSCSWRHAGGVVANMRQSGDYMDYYCSGILNDIDDDEFRALTKEQQEAYLFVKNNYVAEGNVTDEVKADFLKLGWTVVE